MGLVVRYCLISCALAGCSTLLWAKENVDETIPLVLGVDHLSPLPSDIETPLVPSKRGLQLLSGSAHPFEIVTVPATPGTVRVDRPRHALRMTSQTVANAMRQFGFQVSQCETLTRLPSKLKRDEGSPRLELALTFKVSCKY
ncbi:hypothetical protein ACUHMQ_20260 [Chitinimonas sp. PSY-7]|uniref:hypothetical protein n=1 Tax=Chitinimonas sp. PSY-7 TaxID=3459088 RepID=UPI0040402F80